MTDKTPEELDELSNEELRDQADYSQFWALVQGVNWTVATVAVGVIAYLVSPWIGLICFYTGLEAYFKFKKFWFIYKAMRTLSRTMELVSQIDFEADESREDIVAQALNYSMQRMRYGMTPEESLERLRQDLKPYLEE